MPKDCGDLNSDGGRGRTFNPSELTICGDGPPLALIVGRFVNEVSRASTIDTYLIKMSTLLYSVKDLYKDDISILAVFRCREVVEALSPLTNYIDQVEEIIKTDPRHRSLRPYLDYILAAIRLSLQLSPSNKALTTKRPATWYAEYMEKSGEIEAAVKKVQVEVVPKKRRRRALPLVAVLLMLVAIAVIISFPNIIHIPIPVLPNFSINMPSTPTVSPISTTHPFSITTPLIIQSSTTSATMSTPLPTTTVAVGHYSRVILDVGGFRMWDNSTHFILEWSYFPGGIRLGLPITLSNGTTV